MANQLPILNAYGVFTLLPPYVSVSENYRCAAMQLITAMVANDVDVFTDYYLPAGLSKEQYQTDLNNNVAIVTLLGPDNAAIVLPSSFINTMPIEVTVPYVKKVISIDLGLVPVDYLPLEVLTGLSDFIAERTGIIPVHKVHQLPIRHHVTQPEHLIKEAMRLNALANHQSFYTAMLNANEELAKARTKIVDLETALIALQ